VIYFFFAVDKNPFGLHRGSRCGTIRPKGTAMGTRELHDIGSRIVGTLSWVGALTNEGRSELIKIVEQTVRSSRRANRHIRHIRELIGWAVLVAGRPIAYIPSAILENDAMIFDPIVVLPTFEHRGLKCLAIPKQVMVSVFSAPDSVPVSVLARPSHTPEDDVSYTKYGFETYDQRFCDETGRPFLRLHVPKVTISAAILLECLLRKGAITEGAKGCMAISLSRQGTYFSPAFKPELQRLASGNIQTVGCEEAPAYQFTRRTIEC
jgi:hypothetical protein